jgi:hypothetical protein
MSSDNKGKAPPGQKYQESAASLEEIVSHLPDDEREEWASFRHLRVEPAFQDRVFIVWNAGTRDDPPKIVATLRVVSFVAKDDTGCIIRLLNDATGKEMEVTHVPKKLFGYPIFVAIPPAFTLRWDVRYHAGQALRSLSYLMFFKTKSRSDFFGKGVFYVDTPNKLRELYPKLDLKLDL